MKYLGKKVEYLTNDGTLRVATVKKIGFHEGLKKPIFTCQSPSGHIIRLTKDELYKSKHIDSIGKKIEYVVNDGTRRTATITEINYHDGIKKDVFTCISPYGNMLRLSIDEIDKFL